MQKIIKELKEGKVKATSYRYVSFSDEFITLDKRDFNKNYIHKDEVIKLVKKHWFGQDYQIKALLDELNDQCIAGK